MCIRDRNKSKQKGIVSGADIVSINTITPQQLHNKYRKIYASDGLNKTYLERAFSKRFTNYLTNEIGMKDSLYYVFRQNDSLKEIVVSRLKAEKKEKVKKTETAPKVTETNPKTEKKVVDSLSLIHI